MAAVDEQPASVGNGEAPEEEEQEPSSAEKAQMEMRRRIMQIMQDTTLTDAEKAQRRQDLLSGKWSAKPAEAEAGTSKQGAGKKEAAPKKAGEAGGGAKPNDLLEDTLKCVICFNLCERPVTGPCQHNYCLACFKRWLGQGKKTCPTCRANFPAKFIENPRINTLLTYAIRCAKQGIRNDAPKAYARIADESRPAEAFTTERAVRAGRANAASGRIMVNVPNDHFGPILPEHDPVNAKGVQVGDWWKDRLDCRQWGAHFPHVAGIAGQSNRGAQSVVLSGGYEDDHDEGEWFLYTGSGGRDLSGNKRTNKTQSFDQTFDSMNAALKMSCVRGLPVRVVRSAKEKRSSYAPGPETPVRYDGIYRILRCWRKKGAQGFLMCRYLFVRCDNAPAPWTSDEAGDGLRLEVPGLAAKEIAAAQGTVYEMSDKPHWDFNADKGEWGWARDPPPSQKAPGGGDAAKKLKKKASAHERLLRDFSCSLCKGVLDNPLSMPCGHNFCKGCLDGRFAATEAAAAGGSKALAEAKPARSLRVRKVPKPCPTCKTDLADYLTHAAVNTEMAELIRRLQAAAEEAHRAAAQEAAEQAAAAASDDDGAGGAAAAAAAAGTSKAAAAAAGAGSDADDEEEEEEAAGSGEEEDEEEEQAPNAKKRRVAGAAAAAAAGGGGEEAAPEEPQQQQQPAAAAVPAPAAAAAGGSRYASEVAGLLESFPEFDGELIAGLLEDQGGDTEEVHAYLKRMKNQLAHAQRQAGKAAGGGAGSSSGKAKAKGKGRAAASSSKKGAKGKKQQQAQEEEEEEEEEEDKVQDDEEEEEEQQQQSGGEEGGVDLADTMPESDTDTGRKQQAAEAAAAKPAAAAEAGGGKKRRQASADGAQSKKRCTR